MNKFTAPVLGLLLAMTAINSWDTIGKWWAGSGPAIEWRSVDVLTQVVNPGGKLEMVYTAIIHRHCPSEIRGFVVAGDGSVPIRFPPVSGGYTPASEDPVRVRISLIMPKEADPGLGQLQSGDHVYRTVTTRFCPGGVETDNDVPDAKFYLEVP